MKDISCCFVGKLEDGTEFDSSLSRSEPFVFTLGVGQVIKGWDQGKFDSKFDSKLICAFALCTINLL